MLTRSEMWPLWQGMGRRHEVMTGHRPDVSKLRVFGSVCYTHTPKELRNKLQNRAEQCVLLGHGMGSVARVYVHGKVKLARDFMVDETKLGWIADEQEPSEDLMNVWWASMLQIPDSKKSSETSKGGSNAAPAGPSTSANDTQGGHESCPHDSNDVPEHTDEVNAASEHPHGPTAGANAVLESQDGGTEEPDVAPEEESEEEDGEDEGVFHTPEPQQSGTQYYKIDENSDSDQEDPPGNPGNVGDSQLSPLNAVDVVPEVQPAVSEPAQDANADAGTGSTQPRRSGRVRRPPSEWQQGVAKVADVPPDPPTLKVAQQSTQWPEWHEAMLEEFSALQHRGTWELCERPKEHPVLPCKWVYKVKTNPDGSVERFKARLVAGGHRQVAGVDYEEVFAPVTRWTTLRLLLSKVAQEQLHITAVDISNAFLYGTLKEEVYMSQPALFDDGTGRVCRLKKTLYGLKQAPREWYQELKKSMEKLGFRESEDDGGLWVRQGKEGEVKVFAVSWVDDLLITSSNLKLLNSVKGALLSMFKGRDLGVPTSYLGASIEYDRVHGTVKVSQSKYIDALAQRFDMQSCRPKTTPLPSGTIVDSRHEEEQDVKGEVPYQELVGALLYAANVCRPDIACSVSMLARYSSNPSNRHWELLKGVLKYLYTTKELGIVYSKDGGEIQCYVDSDYATCRDTRRSRTGYVLLSAGGAVSWQSALQKVVANSTAEAEYIAASKAVKEAIWLGRVAFTLGLKEPGPVTIMVDNQAALAIAKGSSMSAKTKHIAVAYHNVRTSVAHNQVALQYVSTKENTADILTKAVTFEVFGHLRSKLGMK